MEFVCGLPFDLDVSPKLTPYPTTLLTSIFMTPKDIYIKQLLGLGRGVPLYEPGKVHVGDVGFIDPRDGFFEKLYNIAEPHKDKRGCPPAIKLKKTKYNRKWGHFYVCYLFCFILKTLPDFVIILDGEIRGIGSLVASSHVGQPVTVHRPIAEIRSSAPKFQVKCNLNSQTSNKVNAS
jgi:hypothetical protein